MREIAFAALSAALFCAPAHAGPLSSKTTAKVPFSYSVKGVAEPADQPFTIITLEVRNNTDEVQSASFRCELKNPSGATWEARGRALNFSANEVRDVRLAADRDSISHGPNAVNCTVIGFDAPALKPD